MTLLRPDVAAVAPATWPRGLSRRHQKRREEFHGKPWRDLMAMYRIHVFHVLFNVFFLLFLVILFMAIYPWGFNQGCSLYHSRTVLDDPRLIRK